MDLSKHRTYLQSIAGIAAQLAALPDERLSVVADQLDVYDLECTDADLETALLQATVDVDREVAAAGTADRLLTRLAVA